MGSGPAKCPLCGAAHWSREPHQWPKTSKVEILAKVREQVEKIVKKPDKPVADKPANLSRAEYMRVYMKKYQAARRAKAKT